MVTRWLGAAAIFVAVLGWHAEAHAACSTSMLPNGAGGTSICTTCCNGSYCTTTCS